MIEMRHRSLGATVMPSKQEFVALSNFRHRLACFVRFSTDASRSAGLTMTQYLLLLHLAGRPGREWAHVGELAECLQASPHGTVALVDRCETLGLVQRRPSADDGRSVEVHLTAKGGRLVELIANMHRNELQGFRDVFRVQNVNDLAPVDLAAAPAAAGKPLPSPHRKAGRAAARRKPVVAS